MKFFTTLILCLVGRTVGPCFTYVPQFLRQVKILCSIGIPYLRNVGFCRHFIFIHVSENRYRGELSAVQVIPCLCLFFGEIALENFARTFLSSSLVWKRTRRVVVTSSVFQTNTWWRKRNPWSRRSISRRGDKSLQLCWQKKNHEEKTSWQ
jgi:hypothetical protein